MRLTDEAQGAVEFGRFQLLPHRRELRADGLALDLGSRAFDVLMVLIEARGALVTKDEIMARVWPDTVVEENNLVVQISALRKALGEDRDLIRTVSGRGYRFIAEIRKSVPDPAAKQGSSRVSPGTHRRQSRRAICQRRSRACSAARSCRKREQISGRVLSSSPTLVHGQTDCSARWLGGFSPSV